MGQRKLPAKAEHPPVSHHQMEFISKVDSTSDNQAEQVSPRTGDNGVSLCGITTRTRQTRQVIKDQTSMFPQQRREKQKPIMTNPPTPWGN